MEIPWQTALTGVLFSGVIFVILTLTGLREYVINSIPMEMKMAVSAVLDFHNFVGLQSSGVIAGDESTLISLGDVQSGGVLLTFAGLLLLLYNTKVPAAIFIGAIATAILGILTIVQCLRLSSVLFRGSTDIWCAFEGLFDFDTIFNVQFPIVVLTFLFVAL